MSEPRRIPIYRLVEIASCFSRVGVVEIRGPYRHNHFAMPRFAVAYVAARAGWSTPKIGKAIGRDHSTIMHGIRRAEDTIKRDQRFAEMVQAMQDCADAWERGEREPSFDWLRHVEVVPFIPKAKPRVSIDIKAQRRIKNELAEDDVDAMMRLRGSLRLIAAIRREHPERCLAA